MWYIAVIEAIMMLMAWSLLYKETPIYRIGEHIAIGLFLGFTLHMGVDVLLKRVFIPLATGGATVGLILATIIGILFYTRYIKSVSFISRWSTAILVGCGSGVAVKGAIKAMIVGQLPQKSWFAPGIAGINNVITTVATVSVMCYFLFSYKHEGLLGYISKIGRLFLMACFGVTLGVFLLSNIGFAIGMTMKLVVPPAAYVTIIAIILIVADIMYGRMR